MSSGFSGSFPDFFNSNGGGVNNFAGRSMSMMNVNSNVNWSSYRSPLAGILSDTSSPVVGSRSDFNGKRSLAELQQQQAAIYLRNVRPRAYNQLQMEFLCSPEVSSIPQQLRRNLHGALSNYQINDYSPTITKQASQKQEMDTKMLNRLQELEKELLLDDEEEENDAVSVVTDTAEWSETIQRLLNPENNTVSPSPTTSSTSSSASSSASVSPKQFVSDAAEAITDGKTEIAEELITHIDKHFNARGSPEQRLGFYMASALRSRVSVNSTPSPATELYRKEHILSTQLLYDKSPCFKIAFIAANNLILQALLGNSEIAERKIHVVDFDIGHGFQYVSLLHEIAAARKSFGGINIPISLKLTTFKDFGNGGSERLRLVGDELKSLANKLGVLFYYNVLDFKLSDLNRQGLAIGNDDVLAVNFAFKLSKFPDESVTTENLRDEVLRRVKGLSPGVVTVVEQELNANTASFTARVNDLFSYYTSFLNSLEATIPRGDIERVKIEEGLSRRIFNSVACEGRDRVERCEVFGKWRARLRMAGFESKPVSQLTVESLMSKMNSWTRGNVGFTVKEESGGISFGWMGRTLTVVSAWH